MSNANFTKTANKEGIIVEKSRIVDLNDPKWAHPDGAELWYVDPALNAGSIAMYEPTVAGEEKLKNGNERQKSYMDQWWNAEHTCEITKHMVSGCPEEPNTGVEVWVVKPKNLKKRKKTCVTCVGHSYKAKSYFHFSI